VHAGGTKISQVGRSYVMVLISRPHTDDLELRLKIPNVLSRDVRDQILLKKYGLCLGLLIKPVRAYLVSCLLFGSVI